MLESCSTCITNSSTESLLTAVTCRLAHRYLLKAIANSSKRSDGENELMKLWNLS